MHNLSKFTMMMVARFLSVDMSVVLLTLCVFFLTPLRSYAVQPNCSSTFHKLNVTCQDGRYFNPYKQICESCKICRVGKGVRCPCKGFSNTKCERCSKGTYSKLHQSGNRFCTPCKQCRSYEVQTMKCNMTDDAICKPDENNKKEPHDHSIYLWVIIVLSLFVVCTICAIVWLLYYGRNKRNEQPTGLLRRTDGRETDASQASEANIWEGSSYSSLEDPRWRRDRTKYEREYHKGSSFSSLDRSKDDRSSVQSSLLSSDNYTERPSFKVLKNPDILLSQIPANVYQEIGKLLNPPHAYRDWTTFAGQIGKTQMEIENIRLRGGFDYTERLIMGWCASNPDVTLGELHKILVKMSREDAASVLVRYGKEARIDTPV